MVPKWGADPLPSSAEENIASYAATAALMGLCGGLTLEEMSFASSCQPGSTACEAARAHFDHLALAFAVLCIQGSSSRSLPRKCRRKKGVLDPVARYRGGALAIPFRGENQEKNEKGKPTKQRALQSKVSRCRQRRIRTAPHDRCAVWFKRAMQSLSATSLAALGLLLFFAEVLWLSGATPKLFSGRYGRLHRLLGALELLWLVVGAVDAFQRVTLYGTPILLPWELVYDVVLGTLGTLTALSAAWAFRKAHASSRIDNVASGALDQTSTITVSEMLEHSFYHKLNLAQVLFLYGIPAEETRARLALALLATTPWLVRSWYPVNRFSDNYKRQGERLLRFCVECGAGLTLRPASPRHQWVVSLWRLVSLEEVPVPSIQAFPLTRPARESGHLGLRGRHSDHADVSPVLGVPERGVRHGVLPADAGQAQV
eukprot:scaffold8478_cov286-Pinguiococcus_pyrenoidosus.AAC.5